MASVSDFLMNELANGPKIEVVDPDKEDVSIEGTSVRQPESKTQPPAAKEEVVVEEVEEEDVAEIKEAPPVVKEVEYSYTDVDGKKKTAKVDLNNHEEIQKIASMAQGARKWQAERDAARKDLKDKNEAVAKLEAAYKAKGAEGVFDLIEGRDGAFKEMKEREYARRRAKEDASPDEQKILEAQEQAEHSKAELRKLQAELDDRVKRANEMSNKAEVRKVEALTHPAFASHRFSGKLGDAEAEAMYDKVLWANSMQEIQNQKNAVGDDFELTPELVESVFAKQAAIFRRTIKEQASKEATKVIEDKKETAASKAAAASTKPRVATNKAAEADKAGNTWDFIGTLLGGKKG
jgi:hypothetical protein